MATQIPVADLSQQATLVFEGTVVQSGAATFAAYPATVTTAIVRVDTIVRAPQALRNFAGRDVTVQLRPRSRVRVGQRAVFFTEGLMYGDGLAVRELGRRSITEAREPAIRRMEVTVAAHPIPGCVQRVDSATAVITGQVTATEAMPSPLPTISEHDPQWREARVTVEEVTKGNVASNEVSVTYAASDDVAWYRSPKLMSGTAASSCCIRGKRCKAWARSRLTWPPQTSQSSIRWTFSQSSNATRCGLWQPKASTEHQRRKKTHIRRPGHRASPRRPRRKEPANDLRRQHDAAGFSGEANQDSEPKIGVNPENTNLIAAAAFTGDPMGGPHAPIYVSSDGEATWSLMSIVPGGGPLGTGDITLRFAGQNGTLYASILRGDTRLRLNILRTDNPLSPTPMTVLVERDSVDQPFVEATTVPAGPDTGDDRVYVGCNDFGTPLPNGLHRDHRSLPRRDASGAPAGFVSFPDCGTRNRRPKRAPD